MAQVILTDDEIGQLCESWKRSTQLRVYKHLFNLGCTMAAIEVHISKALKEEKANG